MKLAHALMERKAIKTKMDELRARIYQNAQVEQGGEPTESPLTLLDQLEVESQRFQALVARINDTNLSARLPDGTPLGEAVLRKDMLRYLHATLLCLAKKAVVVPERYSQREIKNIPALPIPEVHHRADEVAKQLRLLDAAVQELNWQIDLR